MSALEKMARELADRIGPHNLLTTAEMRAIEALAEAIAETPELPFVIESLEAE